MENALASCECVARTVVTGSSSGGGGSFAACRLVNISLLAFQVHQKCPEMKVRYKQRKS